MQYSLRLYFPLRSRLFQSKRNTLYFKCSIFKIFQSYLVGCRINAWVYIFIFSLRWNELNGKPNSDDQQCGELWPSMEMIASSGRCLIDKNKQITSTTSRRQMDATIACISFENWLNWTSYEFTKNKLKAEFHLTLHFVYIQLNSIILKTPRNEIH